MFQYESTLKSDAFGKIEKGMLITDDTSTPAIRRVYTRNPWITPLARLLARNEKRALGRLMPLKSPYFPTLLEVGRHSHVRSFIQGDSMHRANDRLTPDFFKSSRHLLLTLKRAGVVNNDLAKEANWIITPDSTPSVTDFQLAFCFKNRVSKWFLTLCYEDLRHLLKHKRKYHSVTAKETKVLASKSWISVVWMKTGKRVYHWVTRRLLGWSERQGPEERDI